MCSQDFVSAAIFNLIIFWTGSQSAWISRDCADR